MNTEDDPDDIMDRFLEQLDAQVKAPRPLILIDVSGLPEWLTRAMFDSMKKLKTGKDYEG